MICKDSDLDNIERMLQPEPSNFNTELLRAWLARTRAADAIIYNIDSQKKDTLNAEYLRLCGKTDV